MLIKYMPQVCCIVFEVSSLVFNWAFIMHCLREFSFDLLEISELVTLCMQAKSMFSRRIFILRFVHEITVNNGEINQTPTVKSLTYTWFKKY